MAGAAEGDPKLPVERLKLENGLEVLLHPDRSLPQVYVSVWYHVGAGDEAPGESGLVHLFEHLLVGGSANLGEGRALPILRAAGATGVNATASTDRLSTFALLPAHQLETALWVESDRMGHLLPLVTPVRLDEERARVQAERRVRIDEVPYGADFVTTHRLLYDEGHPYRPTVIGRPEDLAAADVAELHAFFRKWFVPANATLAIAGDFDGEAAKKLVEKWFGSFPRTTRPARRALPASVVAGPRRATVNDEHARLRRVHWSWHSPKAFAPGDVELEALASVLGRAGTGRLHKLLVEDKALAVRVAAGQRSRQLSSVFSVEVDLRPEADLATVEKLLEVEIERVGKEPISERERKRVLTEVEAAFVRGLEPLESRAETLQSYNHYLGNPDGFTRHLDLFRKASAEEIRRQAALHLTRDRRVEVITMPRAPAPATPAGATAAKEAK